MRELTEGLQLADRYTLLRRLGRGGMCEVWQATDRRADGPVALKFLNADLAASGRQRELFHNEWRTASRLMHAHIVRVFEYHDDDDEAPYYALQYVEGPPAGVLEGQSLDHLLGPLGLLADALRYAHGKGIVHGDVTAANVLLDGRGAPYLVDFGVSRAAGAGGGRGGGTPVALSPERRAGEPAEPADDIYALGVLLHELIFGAPPAGETLPAAAASGERLPTALRELLGRMLAGQRSARPTAGDVADGLAAAGFPPRPAKLPGGRSTPADDDAEIRVRSVRPARQHAAAAQPSAAAEGTGRGVPATVVVAGLAVLLLALLGVLFLLPPAERPGSRAAAPVPQEAPDAGTPAAVIPGEEDAGADPGGAAAGDMPFSENVAPVDAGSGARLKAATDEALGDLLSRLERLRYRGIERWGGGDYEAALERYADGDRAYIDKDYAAAGDHYRATIEMLEPFFDRIDTVFSETMQAARAAFEARDHREAIRLYDLAVAITPGNPAAELGLQRSRSLEDVLGLMERGRQFESDLELNAAREAYSRVLELDERWQPAREALERVLAALDQRRFEQLMTDGFTALSVGNFDNARAAFEAAKRMRPGAAEPRDGLLQVDQAARLERIRALEVAASEHETNERWESAVDTYQQALEVDGDLQFAQEGLARAGQRAALHRRLQQYIDDPDSLSSPGVMQAATNLLLELSRISPSGPRLEDQKESLSRLLKRAATPLTVELRSDNQTQVSIFRIGTLGTFGERQLKLRPGSYVAMGSRPGYRDVRLEFRVAPEIEMQPIVVMCEERI